MIWLSLKTYKEATGDEAIKLLKIVKKVMDDTGVKIIPCVQPTDIYRAVQEVGIEVWAQHVDPIDPGRHFGWLSPYSAKQAGATGTVINHDEHAMQYENIKQTIEKAKEYELKTLVICDSVELGHRVTAWEPDYIAYEKGDLIAGPVAMVDQEAESIKELISLVKQPLIVGAGISTGEHAQKSIELGAKGVILASAVVKAEHPEKKLRELAEPFMEK
jgi:triosephosphate isomerase